MKLSAVLFDYKERGFSESQSWVGFYLFSVKTRWIIRMVFSGQV